MSIMKEAITKAEKLAAAKAEAIAKAAEVAAKLAAKAEADARTEKLAAKEAEKLAKADAKAKAEAEAEAKFLDLATADGESSENWPKAAMLFTANVGAKIWTVNDAERLTKAYLERKASAAPASAKADAIAAAQNAKSVKATVSTLKSFAADPVVALGQAFFDDVLSARNRQTKEERKRTMLALYAANVQLTKLAGSLNWVTAALVREGYDALANREEVVSRWCGNFKPKPTLGAKLKSALDAMATRLDGEKTVMTAFPKTYSAGLDVASMLRTLADRIMKEEAAIIASQEAEAMERLAEAEAREAEETKKVLEGVE